ncbi:MAG: adenosylmethionine decarboxylase [Thermocladium sp.]|jgi:S-adenosylmethionine decarboxylase|nr:MAG: S-adenosylmethionine decarboxylase proenzyme [Thermocladium sp. ECH_B]
MTATTYIQTSTGEKNAAAVYGIHIYGNLYGCDESLLSDEVFLLQLVKEAAEVANATVISAFYHKFGSSGGVSAVAIVAESHISIHTWPEHGYATVDVYTCGEHTKPMAAFEFIVKKLHASRYDVHVSDRSMYYEES